MAVDTNPLNKNILEDLLRPKLDADSIQIESIAVRRLTKQGDNYGSTMLAVDVSLKSGTRTLHLVAKMLPKSIILQEFFQCSVTVRKEIDLYLFVRPEYERIQKENNLPDDKYLDVFPLCYGARASWKGDSAPVDEGAVILLENLKEQGYICADRFSGLDLTHCELVVDKLARFHATAIAIKIKKPEEFKATILKATNFVAVCLPYDIVLKRLEEIHEYQTMKEKINTALMKGREVFKNNYLRSPREPFATFTHLDLWTNNIMFQYEPDSTKRIPKNVKFVDFQLTGYDSPARDLLFFLYTSANMEVLSGHYEYLVRFYYDRFLDCLKILDCDTTPFAFDEFLKELEYSSIVEFWHLAIMIKVVTRSEEEAFSTDNMTYEDLRIKCNYPRAYTRRFGKLALDFASRNWI
ncbi:hypothetical protein PR048_026199 [Dryococelus australis]|uniref:CHK kinase-like domain-containing protein n=1 Tax=Dryococelus australis TaxID=614101 RepID=A0ABQ9GKP4_9NEOP|nr:hypothetical protein PR048_026199 [Dryococelus australis]